MLVLATNHLWAEEALASRNIQHGKCDMEEIQSSSSLSLTPSSLAAAVADELHDASFNNKKRLTPSLSSGSLVTTDNSADDDDIVEGKLVNESLELFTTGKYGQNYEDVRGPYQVQKRIQTILSMWTKTIPISPHQYLLNLLKSRGYDTKLIWSTLSSYRREPSPEQIRDYDNKLVWAVRNSDINTLKELKAAGKCLSACNRFSESIVHMACRRSDFETVLFLLTNGASHCIVDDFGRTPLHDACWRPEPRFDIVTLILEKDLTLLRMIDTRGYMPLDYVRDDHWLEWCAYFYHQKEKFWTVFDDKIMKSRSEDISNYNSMSLQQSFFSSNCNGPLYWESSHVTIK